MCLAPGRALSVLRGRQDHPGNQNEETRQSIELANNHGMCAVVLEVARVVLIMTQRGLAVMISVTQSGKRGPRLGHED